MTQSLSALLRFFRSDRLIGSYVPGNTNYLLLVVQIAFAVQGGSRGEDYVFPRPDGAKVSSSLSELERAFPLPVWGTGFLLGAGLVLVGLVIGRLMMIVAGHIVLAALYVSFAYSLLTDAPISNIWMAVAGGIVLCIGLVIGVLRRPGHELARALVSILLIGIGGWVAGFGLGYDFRTGTGLATAALVHAVFAIGLVWVSSRVPGRKIIT